MSRMEDYKYTSLEQRVKVPFARTIQREMPPVSRVTPEQLTLEPQYRQLPLEIPMTEGEIFPLSTAQPAPVQPRIGGKE